MISLNFAMFRSAFEQGAQLGAGPVARLWRGLLVFFSRWWQLETLYRSNMKYQPEWVPRYACYEDARLVPRVGVASVIAEGFLVLPFTPSRPNSTPGITSRHRRTWSRPGLLRHDGSAPDLTGLRPTCPTARTSRGCPNRCGSGWPSSKALQDSGIDAYPVGQPPSHTVAAGGRGADGAGGDSGGARAADPRLRRCVVRAVA